MSLAPAPLFLDPIHDGAADPTIIWNRQEKQWWIVYTARRADAPGPGVAWAHGTDLGVCSSDDGGRTWLYRGTLELEPAEPGRNTYWAPEILYADGLYHMYVSYITGVPASWTGLRHILHYTSEDLWHWRYISTLSALGNRVIDACVYPLPQGGWRMFYKNEAVGSHTQYADSPDLYAWEPQGDATWDCPQEGPNVFPLGEDIFMICDMWKGLIAYRSADLTHWEPLPGRLLDTPGTRPEDCAIGHHADVLSLGDKAYLFYFVHPGEGSVEGFAARRSALQVAQLRNEDGQLCILRDEPFDFTLPTPTDEEARSSRF